MEKNNQKNVLMSIHTQYALKIINGQKTIELRKKFPIFEKKEKRKIFVYACSPISKIIGECQIQEVKKLSIKKLWGISKKSAMIHFDSFQKYFKDCNFGFAIYLTKPIKYNKFIDLETMFGTKTYPPQSYRYIDNNLIIHN